MSDLSAEAESKSSAAASSSAASVASSAAAAPPPSAAAAPLKKKEEMRNESTGITVGDSTHTLADVSHTTSAALSLWH